MLARQLLRHGATCAVRGYALDFPVPGDGFEPPTNGLQNRCSTTELTRQRPVSTTLFHFRKRTKYEIATGLPPGGRFYFSSAGLIAAAALLSPLRNRCA
jgi:hypothetical protein